MTLPELYVTVRELRRAEKLRLMQFLVIDLAHEEGVALLAADAEYPIWTPLNAVAAAETLWQMLEQHKAAA